MKKRVQVILMLALLFALTFLTQTPVKAQEKLTLTITLDKTSVEAGQPITASWTIIGGTEPYSIKWATWWITESNGEETILQAEVVNNKSILLPQFGATGSFYVDITDAAGYSEGFRSADFAITGASVAEPFVVNIDLDKETVVAGKPITASWTINGGAEPYVVDWIDWILVDANGNERFYDSKAAGNSSELIPQLGVKGMFRIFVRDAAGRERYVTAPFTITDAVDRPYVSIKLDKSGVEAGQPITASWTITGGTEPYSIKWASWWITESNGEQTNMQADIVGNQCVLIPQIGKTGYFYMEITDATGYTERFQSLDFTITGAVTADPFVVNIDLDKATVVAGKPITASWTISGGTEPYVVDWILVDVNGNEVFYDSIAAGNSSELIPQLGMTGMFRIYVTDAAGREKYLTAPFTVTDAPDEEEAVEGDANGDSTIDILDLVSIIDYIVSNNDPTSLKNADANGDGVVDILDLVWIIDQIVGG